MNTYSVINPLLYRDNKFISSCKSADAPPTLDVLQYFHVKNGHIDCPEEIGSDYEKFGTLLLEDKTENKLKNIRVSERDDPLLITVEILCQWLQGKGKEPVTWRILVECLRATGLTVLADRIDDSLSKQDESKEIWGEIIQSYNFCIHFKFPHFMLATTDTLHKLSLVHCHSLMAVCFVSLLTKISLNCIHYKYISPTCMQ